MYKICSLIVALILISHTLCGIDFHDFDAYQCKLTAKEIELRSKGIWKKIKSSADFIG